MVHFIAILALFQWSGTKSALSQSMTVADNTVIILCGHMVTGLTVGIIL